MNKYWVVAALGLALLWSAPALSQTTSDNIADDQLEGITLNVSDAAPSILGLWWRGIKERVAVALTFDPVKKAEKRLQYAAERLQLTQVIAAKADDPKIQERAQNIMARAQEMVQTVEAQQNEWLNNPDERAQQLLRNVLRVQLRREQMMDALEEKIPADNSEKLRALRAEALGSSERLLNALNNVNIPETTQQQLQAVKERIEAQAAAVRQYQEDKQEILSKIKEGDYAAKEQLQELNENRIKTLQTIRERYQEAKEALKEAVVSSTNAVRTQLKTLEQQRERVEQTTENQTTSKTKTENETDDDSTDDSSERQSGR